MRTRTLHHTQFYRKLPPLHKLQKQKDRKKKKTYICTEGCTMDCLIPSIISEGHISSLFQHVRQQMYTSLGRCHLSTQDSCNSLHTRSCNNLMNNNIKTIICIIEPLGFIYIATINQSSVVYYILQLQNHYISSFKHRDCMICTFNIMQCVKIKIIHFFYCDVFDIYCLLKHFCAKFM